MTTTTCIIYGVSMDKQNIARERILNALRVLGEYVPNACLWENFCLECAYCNALCSSASDLSDLVDLRDLA